MEEFEELVDYSRCSPSRCSPGCVADWEGLRGLPEVITLVSQLFQGCASFISFTGEKMGSRKAKR